jgi:aryl-alcohol dehydrogenase-like predicted oxidoreductase
MDHVRLGNTGLLVSKLCLGTMTFGLQCDETTSAAIMDRAADGGITFFDTADVYPLGGGLSTVGRTEEIVGEWLRGKREKFVVATKCVGRTGPAAWEQGSSRKHVLAAVEGSLRRLGTDYIDLYQVHRPDETTDIDETLGALSELVHAGKIRTFGSSTYPAERIVEAQWVAERRGRERFMTEQPPYSLLVRGIERDVLPVAQTYGMGVIPWSPLAGGWLSGRFGTGKENTSRRAGRIPGRYDLTILANQRKLEIVNQLAEVADQAGLTLIELALAFVLEHPAVSAAIIGPRTMEQLESQLSAPQIRLESALLDRLDEINPPGTNVNPEDAGWSPPSLVNASRRRRRH